MTPEQLYAVIGSNVVAIAVVSGIVGTFFLRTVSRLDWRIDYDKAAADADRRAFQAGIETFRTEMQTPTTSGERLSRDGNTKGIM